jgi:ankyrin repeat protein
MADENDVIIEGQIVDNSWFVSAINGKLKDLEKLYKENTGRQDGSGCTALMYTSNLGHIDCVKFLIKNCKNELRKTDKNKRTALMYAAMAGHVEIVKLLVVFEGGTSDDSGMSAYDYATKNNHTECMKVLQDKVDTSAGDDVEKNKKKLESLYNANTDMQKAIDNAKQQKRGSGMSI